MKGLFTISMIYNTRFSHGQIKSSMFSPKIPLAKKDFLNKQEMQKMRYSINASEFTKYVLRADQQIAGEIYFHYFQEFVQNEKLILSRRLKDIFFVFDSSVEKMISKIIYSKFLFVDIPKDLLDRNRFIMNEIFDCLQKIKNKIERPDSLEEPVDLRNTLRNLKKLIDAKSLSPVLIQRVLGYYNIEEYFFNLMFCDFYSAEFLEDFAQNASEFIEKFNKKLWYKALYAIFKSGNHNDPNLPQSFKRIIKNLYDPMLNAEEYENLNGEDRYENLVVYQIYKDLERILFFLVENLNDPEKQFEIVPLILKTQGILIFFVF
ncbi:hypothetical protein DMUE_4408 [Dictyocoela muelleri]|nr:hypothetical protein DMUE_4408 [Dictyocoela muelleri]